MNFAEKLLLDFIEATIKGYRQIETSKVFTWEIQKHWNGKVLDFLYASSSRPTYRLISYCLKCP